MNDVAMQMELADMGHTKTMTLQEVADVLGASYDTVQTKAKELGFTRNGVKTQLTLEQVQAIKDNYIPNTFGAVPKVQNALTEIDAARLTAQLLAYYNNKVRELSNAVTEKDAKIIADAPKVDFYDTVVESEDAVDMKQVAKLLRLDMGRTKLFAFLRKKHVLMDDNEPYQEYVDKGYFRVVEAKFNLPDGTIKISKKTVVLQKGLDFIKRITKKEAV